MKDINLPVMMTDADNRVPGILNVARCKCPRCRRGDMFVDKNPYNLKRTMKMYQHCPVCRQPFDIEVGFYYGSSYVSYALSIGISVATLVAWWVLIGLSVNDNRFFYWMGLNGGLLIALQPVLMRMARSIWLAFFVRYDRNWKTNAPAAPERINQDQMNNW